MNKRILTVTLVMVLALSVLAIGCPQVEPAEVVYLPPPPPVVHEWDMQSLWPAGLPGYGVFVEFTERVYEMSDGRLDITPHPAGALVPCFDVLDNVAAGVFEGYHSATTYFVGKEPAFAALLSEPMGFVYAWQLAAWYHEWGGLELARELHAEFDVFYVGPVVFGADSMHFRHPVHSLADFEGMLWRAPHGMAAEFMAKLGASIVILPGGEVYTALDKGLIDGADFINLDSAYAFGWHKVAPYFMMHGLHAPTTETGIVVGMDEWEALCDDLRAILEVAVREFCTRQWNSFEIADLTAREAMLEFGNVEVVLPEECWTAARVIAGELRAEWKEKSPMARRVIESQEEFMRHLGIIE